MRKATTSPETKVSPAMLKAAVGSPKRSAIKPAISGEHWNATVEGLATNVMDLFGNHDMGVVEQVEADYAASKG